MPEFWNAAASDEPLTDERLAQMFEDLWRKYDEELRRQFECPHKSVILHPAEARRLCGPDGIPCPWGCGTILVAP